jgi:hypothetical protein
MNYKNEKYFLKLEYPNKKNFIFQNFRMKKINNNIIKFFILINMILILIIQLMKIIQ